MELKYQRQLTPGESFRKSLELKRQNSADAFGSRTERFGFDELVPTPGVGKYDVTDRSFEIKSPSVSKKGYGVSKAPKTPIFPDTGVPGPCAYSPKLTSIGDIDYKKPSTAFLKSGKGRVPFPPPNKVPGPNAYIINPDPGTPHLLKKKKSFYFESTERRGKFLDVNDIPPPLSYDAFKPLPGPKHDVEWSRSSHTRFSDLYTNNNVPGPERYFRDKHEFEDEYFPRKSLRTAGNYRGRYLGKLQDRPQRQITTFGADKEREKGWFHLGTCHRSEDTRLNSSHSDRSRMPSSA